MTTTLNYHKNTFGFGVAYYTFDARDLARKIKIANRARMSSKELHELLNSYNESVRVFNDIVKKMREDYIKIKKAEAAIKSLLGGNSIRVNVYNPFSSIDNINDNLKCSNQPYFSRTACEKNITTHLNNVSNYNSFARDLVQRHREMITIEHNVKDAFRAAKMEMVKVVKL